MDLTLLCITCNYGHQLQAWLRKDCSLHFVFIGFYKLPLCILFINIYHIDKLHHRCFCVTPLHASCSLRNPMNRESYQHNVQLIQWGSTVLPRISSVSTEWSLRDHLVQVLSPGCTLESYETFKYWMSRPHLQRFWFNWSGRVQESVF